MNTNSNYGFILITKENAKQYEPKLPTDETWSKVGKRWMIVGGNGTEKHFWDDVTYRRPIPPGEGCEMMGLDEQVVPGVIYSYTRNGTYWMDDKWATPYAVKDIIKGTNILAIRRRITKPVTPPSDWQELARQVCIEVAAHSECHCTKGDETCAYCMACKVCDLTKPPVEKTVAERCYEAWKKECIGIIVSYPEEDIRKSAIQFTIGFMEKENKT